jgi:O-antigen/teichoic acid export membrane protein
MVGGLLIIAWVPPDELGIWKSVLIIQTYAGIVQGGIVQGLNRELPFRIGGGNLESVRRFAATAQTSVLASCTLLLVGSIASFFVSRDPMVRVALPTVFLVAATGIYVNYLSATYRADQEFEKLAKVHLGVAALNVVTLLPVYVLGFFGIPLRVLLLGLADVLLLHHFRPIRPFLAFDFKDFVTLMKVGVPLFVVGYLIQVALTFPNTIVLMEAGTEMVGKFAPALAVFAMMTLIPKSISQYVYARMSFRLGQTGDLESLWRNAWKASVGVLAISMPLVIGATVVFPWIVEAFYPKYTESVDSVGWIAVAGAFFGSQMFSSAMNSMKAWKWIYAFTGARVGFAFLIPFLGYRITGGDVLVTVAVGYAAAGVLSFLFGLVCTYWATHPILRRQQ